MSQDLKLRLYYPKMRDVNRRIEIPQCSCILKVNYWLKDHNESFKLHWQFLDDTLDMDQKSSTTQGSRASSISVYSDMQRH